jgi:hypothetical protein
VALVELYDANSDASTKLANVSARTRSGTGGDVLIVGFGIGGIGPKRLLIRGVGPALAQFGVSGTLADPKLTVFSGQTMVAANDNWDGLSTTSAAFTSVGAFALPVGSRDAALVVNLEPGSYTAQVEGVNNTTGIVLIEVYELP